jgi:flagellar FliL protein
MASKSSATAIEHGASDASKKRSMAGKLKIVGIIAAVVLVEWIVAAYVLHGKAPATPPSATDPVNDGAAPADEPEPAAAHSSHGKEAHGKDAKDSKEPVHHGEQEEVDLGEFTVTAYQPVSNSTLFISFHLYGTILHKHSDDFARRLTDTKFRIRDNVIVIIRSAEIADLTDAGLGLIKRRILETTNKTLGKALLQSVMFSDFSFVEQ